jgi:hypothetical protein
MELLLLEILMVLFFAWSLFRFVAGRGGSSWFWASLCLAGFLIVELSVCIAMKESPSEYFLHWFPMAGIAWMILVRLAARFRFRRAASINP